MFSKGYWTHSRFMDVFIEVLNVPFVKPGEYSKLKVRWWNRGQSGTPWLIDPRPQQIKVTKEQYQNWTRVSSVKRSEK